MIENSLNISENQIDKLENKIINFIIENSIAKADDITNLEIKEWNPIIIKSNGVIKCTFTYTPGHTDERYTRAKEVYKQNMLAYEVALNSYIQAENQRRHIQDQQQHLKSYERTPLIRSSPPIEPKYPDAMDYVVWSDSKKSKSIDINYSFTKFSSSDESKFEFLKLINFQNKKRITRGNFNHQSDIDLIKIESDMITTVTSLEKLSSTENDSCTKIIENEINQISYDKVSTHMEKIYNKNIQIIEIENIKNTSNFYTNRFYIGSYKVKNINKLISIDIDKSIINCELISNAGKIIPFIAHHLILFLIMNIASYLLFVDQYYEDLHILIIFGAMYYLGFILIANQFDSKDITSIGKQKNWKPRNKILDKFQEYLKLISFSNSGLSKKTVNLNLMDY